MPSQREEIQFGVTNSLRLLRWNRTVHDVEIVHGPGRATALEGHGDHWHYHRALELTLVQRGAGTRFVADHIELFESGDLVLIGPNVPHYWHQRGHSSGLSIQWDFPLEHGIWTLPESAALRTLSETARRGLHVRNRTAESTRRLIEELPRLTRLARLAVFLQILDGLARAPADDVRPLSARAFSLAGSASQQEAVSQAVSYILAHYRDPVSLPELLRLTSMSRATFARQFRRHAGKSFSAFLNQVRLQAVCHSLRETTDLVGNIALDHGFNQLSFFNRLFRREFGLSPSDYRNGRQPRGAGG
jgi:AraC-like DNA-binding protein